MHAARNAGGSRRSWAAFASELARHTAPAGLVARSISALVANGEEAYRVDVPGDIELSYWDTGYRHPPDWDFWLSFG